ncbi:MAG: ABC transporter ATP-binding protein [Planctomycetota bacterium]|nr:ABC transporter ATP-binding protein [Planctomycetaceae bacterium]MDQ3329110.1 ABC transporter ATP-binding protein [Planctomycetota bacterium]
MPDLEASNLAKTYETTAGPLDVLRGATLSLSRGESAVITGPSGVGKSTLLYLIGLLEPPTSGSLTLLGEEPLRASTAMQADFRNDHIGFVFQDHHLLPQCTVLENVLVPVLAHRSVTADDEQRARDLLGRVGLTARSNHRPAQLSGGERQRAALCRALINRPELVLADEPTGNLDAATATSVGDLLLELASEHDAMLLCVTHSPELASRFPKRFDLKEGTLVGAG